MAAGSGAGGGVPAGGNSRSTTGFFALESLRSLSDRETWQLDEHLPGIIKQVPKAVIVTNSGTGSLLADINRLHLCCTEGRQDSGWAYRCAASGTISALLEALPADGDKMSVIGRFSGDDVKKLRLFERRVIASALRASEEPVDFSQFAGWINDHLKTLLMAIRLSRSGFPVLATHFNDFIQADEASEGAKLETFFSIIRQAANNMIKDTSKHRSTHEIAELITLKKEDVFDMLLLGSLEAFQEVKQSRHLAEQMLAAIPHGASQCLCVGLSTPEGREMKAFPYNDAEARVDFLKQLPVLGFDVDASMVAAEEAAKRTRDDEAYNQVCLDLGAEVGGDDKPGDDGRLEAAKKARLDAVPVRAALAAQKTVSTKSNRFLPGAQ